MKHECHFGLITLTRPPSLCAYFMDATLCLADFTIPFYCGTLSLSYHSNYPGNALLEN